MRIGVIGGGISGLTVGALTGQAGHEVVVFEASREWGGCAGKFKRGDYLFPAGATLGMGFERGGIHTRVLERLDEEVDVRLLDEVMQIEFDDQQIVYYQEREKFMDELTNHFPQHRDGIMTFYQEMWRDFETIRPLFERLPALPFRSRQDIIHALKGIRFKHGRVLPKLNRPLGKTLRAHGLNDTPFERVIDGILLDSLQTEAKDATHLLAAVALSIYHEGAFYVDGGLFQLAHALERAVTKYGGETRLGREIRTVERIADGWLLTDRRGRMEIVDTVVSSIPLKGTVKLLGGEVERTFRRQYQRFLHREQWGTFSLYIVLPESVCFGKPLFRQIYHDSLSTGHAFISMSDHNDQLRTERPERTITVSTHIDLKEWEGWKDRSVYEKLESEWTERLIQVVKTAYPEWDGSPTLALPGGPGAWVKYTKRPNGAVGGYRQTPNQALFQAASYRTDLPQFFVCGDTVFPGAGTIGAMTSGIHVARALGVKI